MNETELDLLTQEEGVDQGADNEAPVDELSAARAELDALRLELKARDEQDRASARMRAELSELEEYFPEVQVEEIPDEVWEKVKSGASLAASYALFRRRGELEKRRISDFNEKNRRMSAGSLASCEGEKYYSPAEVRKMSPAEVRKNYDDIIESMRHWN